MDEADIGKLKDRVRTLEQEVADLRRQMKPRLQGLLEYIREKRVVTSKELRQVFPSCYGGVLSRLLMAIEGDRRYRIIWGVARWSPTIIAYFGNETTPNDPSLMAIDYFQQIPPARIEYTTDAIGKKRRVYRGKEGSLEGIMKVYNIEKEKAYEVWTRILSMFEARIIVNYPQKRFRRKY